MKMVVFGVGYVGLVTGTGLAELGHDVLCVDLDEARVRALKDGEIPIYEPGLSDLVRRCVRSGRLSFATTVTAPFNASDLYFVAVGTPGLPDGTADLRAVHAVAHEVRSLAKKPAYVVVKSTVPVGTCEGVQAIFQGSDPPLEVVSNPEFLKEGDAVQDFFKPDRVVIGVQSDGAREAMRALYAPLQLSGERLVFMDPPSAELTKYAANTLLAMRVSFMNEVSRLCHATGADIHSVRQGVGSDSRIGRRFLFAGPGYGGSCFPKDVRALASLGRARNVPMRLAEATNLANEEQGEFLIKLVEEALGGSVSGKRVALWGLAFKPETDDIREAPSVLLAERLAGRGAIVVGHDPEAGAAFKKALGERVTVVERDYDAVEGADALVLLTEWRSYRAPDFVRIRSSMRPSGSGPTSAPPVVDARNVWRRNDVTRAGLRYFGIGVRAAMP